MRYVIFLLSIACMIAIGYKIHKYKVLKEKIKYEWCMKEYLKDKIHCSIYSTFSEL